MSSSAINTQVAQLKIGNVQNQADSTGVYSNGVWSFKNSTALTSVTITDAGNVGVGVTPLTQSTGKGLEVGRAGHGITSWFNNNNIVANMYYDSVDKFAGTGYAVQYYQDPVNGVHVWRNSSASGSAGGSASMAERMRIDASGNVLVGTTGANVGRVVSKGVGDSYPAFRAETNLTTSQQQISFVNPNGIVGTITSSGTATAYNTGTSDYRLKEQVQDLSDGLSKIKSLRPVSFVWKADQRQDIGFIAHEVQSVIPECVSGEKDGVDAEGNPSYQSIFPAPAQMIANLVAAIQELSAKNDALEARLAALEAK